MKLYGVPASPFVQRVLMTVRAKGGELPLETLPGVSLQSPEFQAMSPMGRVPLLETDSGVRICESDAISAYLDEVLPGPVLMPDDPMTRARVRELLAITMQEFAGGMRHLMVRLVFRMGDSPDIVTAARAQANKALGAIDTLLLGAGSHAVGDRLTPADCALVPVLTLARLIDPLAETQAMIDAQPRVAGYVARIADDPVAARTMTEMRDAFAAMMARNANAQN